MRRIPILILMLSILLAGAAPIARADDPVQRAIAWLHTQQRPDGSFGGASVTADVVYVLALAGENPAGSAWTPPGGQSALNALAVLAPGYVFNDAGQAGKVARAVALAGGNPRAFGGLDLIDIIQKAYDPATGRYHPTAALQAHPGNGRSEAIRRSCARCGPGRVAAGPVAGWRLVLEFRRREERRRYHRTGHAGSWLGRWACVVFPDIVAPQTTWRPRNWRQAGGAFTRPPDSNLANANSTGLAVAGLKAAAFDPDAPPFQKNGLGAQASLLAFQEASGAFVYIRQPGLEEVRLIATVDALNALLQPWLNRRRAGRSICHWSCGRGR